MTEQPGIESLIDYALSRAGEERVADVRIGLGYTAVRLTSGKVGVGAMLRHLLDKAGCSILSYAGTVAGRKVADVIPLLRSESIVEASVGLAAINALAQWEKEMDSPEEDLVRLLRIGPHDAVGMVGNMAPVLERLRHFAERCVVFDDGLPGAEGITEATLEEEILPKCSVVILTATSLLNKTFDRLMELSAGAREICLMGPSTPLIPEVFRPMGVTVLAGRRFIDSERLLRVVSEAGGTRSFGSLSRKVALRIK